MNTPEMLRNICDDIYDITGIKSVIYDADRRLIYAHPRSMGNFCRCLRQDPVNEEKCRGCDCMGFDRCAETEEMTIYRCHMGLTEVMTPILDNGSVIGYLLFGQILPEGAREGIAEKIRNGPYARKEILLRELDEMQVTEARILHASARLIAMCTSCLRLKLPLKTRHESLSIQINDYICENLGDPSLSIASLCRTFGISRGTLYNISSRSFGMGITEYIRRMRVKKAVTLLSRSALPVYQIAEQVGIGDAGYLTKLIRRETGMTPKLFRKAAEAAESEENP